MGVAPAKIIFVVIVSFVASAKIIFMVILSFEVALENSPIL